MITVLLELLNALLEYLDLFMELCNLLIFLLSKLYYHLEMPDSYTCLLCSKLCLHNRHMPSVYTSQRVPICHKMHNRFLLVQSASDGSLLVSGPENFMAKPYKTVLCHFKICSPRLFVEVSCWSLWSGRCPILLISHFHLVHVAVNCSN